MGLPTRQAPVHDATDALRAACPRHGKVLVTARSVIQVPQALQRLRDAGCEVVAQLPPANAAAEWLQRQVRDADAAILAMEPVTDALLAQAPRLKVIARPGVGHDTVDLASATRRGVVVTVAAGANHESVADFSFGLLLAVARGIVPAATSVARGGWERTVGTEVWRKTLAVVGMGRIGQAVARRARGFDMRVLAVTRQGDSHSAADLADEHVTLEQALARADFVSLHAPLTPFTTRIINAERLALMKPGACLVNTSRGGLVDEAALAEAVRQGRLGGAAVDVLDVQGEGTPSPLVGVPGIVVTPHMATFAREAMSRVAHAAVDSVIAVLRGERPAHVVNPDAFMSTPR